MQEPFSLSRPLPVDGARSARAFQHLAEPGEDRGRAMGRNMSTHVLATISPYLCTVARWISEDERSVTFEKDDGRVIQMCKDTYRLVRLEKPGQIRIERKEEPPVISLPGEERIPCPHCKQPAAVIDRTATTVTTCCLECGRTIRKEIV